MVVENTKFMVIENEVKVFEDVSAMSITNVSEDTDATITNVLNQSYPLSPNEIINISGNRIEIDAVGSKVKLLYV